MVRTTHDELKTCIDECTQCHAVCMRTLQHCLGRGGRHAEQEHMRLLADCSQICSTSADFMLRGSPRHGQTCAICAEVCEQCALSCEQMREDELMRQCAEVCRQCALSCREMATIA